MFGIDKIWLYVAAGAAIIAGYFAWQTYQRYIGGESARQEIHQQAERDRAEGIAGARDVRACNDAGGVWSLVNGTCLKP